MASTSLQGTRYSCQRFKRSRVRASSTASSARLDAHGRSRFQLLQNALNKKAKLLYVIFDAMFVGGKDIREKPLLERKKILKALLPHDPLLRYSEHVAEFGKREFAKAQRAHEEGVIAKRAAGLYYSGKRTREWLKFKAVHEQEVVIVGYTEPRRSRKYFRLAGACGTRQSEEALDLCWACRHRLRPGGAEVALWNDAAAAHRQEALRSKSEVRERNHWLIPKLVGEVKFTEWTSDGEMRHPAFLGFRTEKRRSTSSANKHEKDFDVRLRVRKFSASLHFIHTNKISNGQCRHQWGQT